MTRRKFIFLEQSSSINLLNEMSVIEVGSDFTQNKSGWV